MNSIVKKSKTAPNEEKKIYYKNTICWNRHCVRDFVQLSPNFYRALTLSLTTESAGDIFIQEN